MAINAIVFRAAKSTLAETAGGDVADYNFPPELLQLKFGALLRFILFVGSINEGALRDGSSSRFAPRISQVRQPFAVVRSLLRDWPQPLREVLRRMIPQSAKSGHAQLQRHLWKFIDTCSAFFPAGNLDSFTMHSRSS